MGGQQGGKAEGLRPKGALSTYGTNSNIHIRKSNMYLLTIKCNTNIYMHRLAFLHMLGGVCAKDKWGIELSSHYCFELDSLGRLHYHILVTFQRTPMFSVFQVKGWNIHFQRISSWDKGIAYIHKNCESCTNENHIAQWDQREAISYYKFNYGFI